MLCETKSWRPSSNLLNDIATTNISNVAWPILSCCDSHDFCNSDTDEESALEKRGEAMMKLKNETNKWISNKESKNSDEMLTILLGLVAFLLTTVTCYLLLMRYVNFIFLTTLMHLNIYQNILKAICFIKNILSKIHKMYQYLNIHYSIGE